MLQSHMLSLLLVAVGTGIVFSFSMREGTGNRIRFAVKVALIMFGSAMVLGWLMVPFPR